MTQIPPVASLSLDGAWSLGEAAYSEISTHLHRLAPATIVEFGSGVSTIRLGLDFPHSTVVSIEHDAQFRAETIALRDAFALKNVDVVFAPLGYTAKRGRIYQSYRLRPAALPTHIDAVLIDGPPYSAFLGREACLHLVHDRLSIGGLVFLDDYNRTHERRAVANWLTTYPGAYRTTVLEIGHGLCLLEKIDFVQPRTAGASQLSNYKHALAHAWRAITARPVGR